MRAAIQHFTGRALQQVRDPSVALILTTGASTVIRLVSNLILAHLLMPRVFGLVALIMLVATALALLSETGAWVAIVRKADVIDLSWLDQLWTLQATRGFILSLVSVPLGPIIANAYGEPQLAWLLPIANISLFIMGLESLHPFIQQKELRNGLRLKLQLSSQVVGSTVSIALALLSPTPWALVIGILAGTTTSTYLSHAWAAAPVPRLSLSAPFLRDQWKLASWLIVSTALGFFSGQVDRLLFPAWFGMNAFGVYSIAVTMASALLLLGQGFANDVFMPAVGKLSQQHGRAAGQQMRSLTRTVVIYAALLSAMLAGIGPPLFLALYPKSFAPAALFIQILALTTYATFLTYLHRRTFLYQGLIRLEASIEAARLVLFLAAIGLIYFSGSTPTPIEYVALYAIVQAVVYVGLLAIGRAKKLVHFRDDIPGHVVFVLSIAGLRLLSYTLDQHFGMLSSLLACGAAGAIIMIVAASRLGLPKLRPSSAAMDSVELQGTSALDAVANN